MVYFKCPKQVRYNRAKGVCKRFKAATKRRFRPWRRMDAQSHGMMMLARKLRLVNSDASGSGARTLAGLPKAV